jgi:hypothetical protein
MLPISAPRAYQLPYTRTLADCADAVQKRIAAGDEMLGTATQVEDSRDPRDENGKQGDEGVQIGANAGAYRLQRCSLHQKRWSEHHLPRDASHAATRQSEWARRPVTQLATFRRKISSTNSAISRPRSPSSCTTVRIHPRSA